MCAHIRAYAQVCNKSYCLGPGYISLESMEHRGKYVGIKSDGNAGVKDRTNDYTKFYVIIDTPVSH